MDSNEVQKDQQRFISLYLLNNIDTFSISIQISLSLSLSSCSLSTTTQGLSLVFYLWTLHFLLKGPINIKTERALEERQSILDLRKEEKRKKPLEH